MNPNRRPDLLRAAIVRRRARVAVVSALVGLLGVTAACSGSSDGATVAAADGTPSGVARGTTGGTGGTDVTTEAGAVASTIVVGAAKTEVTIPASMTPTSVTAAPGGSATAASGPTTTGTAGSGGEGATTAPSPAGPPTTAAEPTTPTLPRTAQVGLPPPGSEPRNQLDQPLKLDEAGALACAHGEFALEALDAGDLTLVRTEVGLVARWGAPSANAAVSTAATGLASSFAASEARRQIDGFLAVCTANGHVL